MYNNTVNYLRNCKYNKQDCVYNFKKLRTYHLKDTINIIARKYKIPIHVIDGSIKLACASYKSALTNLKNGNIKHFIIRYIKKSKPSHVISIEKSFFFKNGFCKNFLGEMKNNSNFSYLNIKCDSKLHYDKNYNRFTLLVPLKENVKKEPEKNNYIGVDPGTRTFLTGVSNKKIVSIGNNLTSTIKTTFNCLDNITNNKNINNSIKNKHKKRINRRLSNIVDDLHWKSINYLTNNFDAIVIGNLSTKSCVNNKTSKLTKMTKKIILKMSYYKFLQRLAYKCQSKCISLQIVNESYTSKLCSNCCWENVNLNGQKIFKCELCKKNIYRDINGSRNIVIKGFA